MTKKNEDMYVMYEDYKKDLKSLNKVLTKRQKINAQLRDKKRNIGEEYIYNKNTIDITLMNSMMRDTEMDIEMIEGYLDYNDRIYLHRKVKNERNAILSKHTNDGFVPDGEVLFAESVNNVEDIVCNVELQEEIMDLLDRVLTERQRQVVEMYYFEGMTQDKIAKELGITKQAINDNIANSLERLRKSLKAMNFECFFSE